MRRIIMLVAGLALLAFSGVGAAQSSSGYRLESTVMAGGGGRSTSAGFRLEGTIGQGIAGPPAASGASHLIRSGFWPGARLVGLRDLVLHLPFIARLSSGT
jgi:hypothetical protein